MIKQILFAGLLASSSMAATGDTIFSSGNQKVNLVELFTSQGCYSCPPADEFLSSLNKENELWNNYVPIAFHVDYWDYIGWKDLFASKNNSMRQRLHKLQGNVKTVYTPGWVVNGKEWRGFFSGKELPIENTPAAELNASLNGRTLDVQFKSSNEKQLTLNVAVLGVGFKTNVSAGENDNKVLQEDFVMLSHEQQNSRDNMWTIELPESIKHDATKYALAVWVHPVNDLVPLQATGGWLPQSLY